jgi:2-polyprenyl-3-methyl-5-hydroxy-6-metoxy-1,4-benzoquinol methylase
MNRLQKISCKYKEKKLFLDVGCGNGQRTVLFDDYSRVIYGVDRLNWLMAENKPKINFSKVDFNCQELSYDSGTFDIVFSFDVIEHLPDAGFMLKEIYRVLKNDGIFVVSTPNRNRLFGFFLQLLGLRKFPYLPEPEKTKDDPYAAHIMEYTISDLKRVVEKAGFSIIRAHKVFYGLTGGSGFCDLFSLPLFHNIILECGKK